MQKESANSCRKETEIVSKAGEDIMTIFEGIGPGMKVGAAIAGTKVGAQSAFFYFIFYFLEKLNKIKIKSCTFCTSFCPG